MAKNVEAIIIGFVAVVIGVALIGPLQTTVTDSNITGIAGTIVALIPLFFGIGVLLVSIRSLMSGKGA